MVKKALLLGINYKNQDGELRGCINDVTSINNILVNHCEYAPQNIRILTEESSVQPTRKNMEAHIQWLVSNTLPGDTLFFYYSGHGSSIKDASSDESDEKDEVLIPLDYKTAGVITDDWLFSNMVSKVPSNVSLWAFTDCCHSGTMMDLKYNYKAMCTLKEGVITKGMPFIPAAWTDKFSFSLERSKDVLGNVYLFSGCQDQETSADALLARKYQGAFSYCLVEYFKNNLIRMSDGSSRFKYGTTKLRNLLKEINCRLDINGFTGQNSQLSCHNQAAFERTFDP